MFSFAEFERDMIVERTREGKEIARQRPDYREGRREIVVEEETFQKCRAEQKRGERTVAECCKVLGISRSTWYERVRRAG